MPVLHFCNPSVMFGSGMLLLRFSPTWHGAQVDIPAAHVAVFGRGSTLGGLRKNVGLFQSSYPSSATVAFLCKCVLQEVLNRHKG